MLLEWGHPFIVSLNFKSHVAHHLLYYISLDSRSILFIIEKKENNLIIFDIGKNIERDDSCSTRFSFSF